MSKLFDNQSTFSKDKFNALRNQYSLKLEKDLRSSMVINVFKEYAAYLMVKSYCIDRLRDYDKAVNEFKFNNANYVDDSVYKIIFESGRNILTIPNNTRNRIKCMIGKTLKTTRGMENYQTYFNDEAIDFDFGKYEEPADTPTATPNTGTEDGDTMLAGYYDELKNKFGKC